MLLSGLYERGDGEKPSMRKVRAFQEQGAGEIPVKATLRKVQQKRKPPERVRMKRRGKSSPAMWRHIGLVNPTWSNVVERHIVVREP